MRLKPGASPATEAHAFGCEDGRMVHGENVNAISRCRQWAAASTLTLLAACGASPTIASIDNDQVRIQANGANLEQARAKAQEACSLQQRTAKLISFRCEDRYCFQGNYFFACRPPSEAN
jgi:hypothetical protein